MSLLAALALAAATFSAPLTLPAVAHIETVVVKSGDVLSGATTTTIPKMTFVYDKTIESRATGYHVNLRPVSTSLGKIDASADEMAKIQAAMADLAMRPYAFTTDDGLAPLAIEDWPGLIASMRKGFVAAVGDSPTGARALDATMSMFERLTPEQAASVMLKEDALLSVPINIELEPGKAVTYEQETANPLGGSPILLNGRIVAESIDHKRQVGVVRWSETFDPASAREATRSFIKTMSAQMGAQAQTPEAQAILDKMKIERSTGCLYEIDLKSGVPLKAECETKIVVTDPSTGQLNGRNERWLITQTLKD